MRLYNNQNSRSVLIYQIDNKYNFDISEPGKSLFFSLSEKGFNQSLTNKIDAFISGKIDIDYFKIYQKQEYIKPVKALNKKIYGYAEYEKEGLI